MALRIVPLKRINLIVGQNNTGKTGLLEALALLLADPPQHAGNLPHLFRSISGDHIENFWKWISYNKDSKNPVEIRAKFDDGPELGIWLGNTIPQNGNHQGSLRKR